MLEGMASSTPLGWLARCTGRWRRSIQGGVAVTFAMSLPVVMAMVGVASDYAMMKKLQAELQHAADAAAIAGAREIPLAKSNQAQVVSAARAFAAYQLTGNSNASTEVLSAKGLALDTAVDEDFTSVKVTISEYWTPFFMHFVSHGVTPVTVTSKARFVGRNNICVLGLAESGTSVKLDKKSRLTANDCGVFANSHDTKAFQADKEAYATASIICTAGGFDAAKSISITPEPLSDCPPVDDPLASRAAPSFGSCDFNSTKINGGTVKLAPGVYCGGIDISGASDVTLSPGIYILKDGGLSVKNDARLTGTGVGFYLTGLAAPIYFATGTTIWLEAPEDGSMAGLLIAEDRALASTLSHRIASDNARKLLGTIYLPVGTLTVDSKKPVADLSAYTAIIVQKLELKEGPSLVLNANYTTSNVPVPEGIAGTHQVILQE